MAAVRGSAVDLRTPASSRSRSEPSEMGGGVKVASLDEGDEEAEV